MITLKKAMTTAMYPYTTLPGAGAFQAQRRAQGNDAPDSEVNEVMSLYTTMPKEVLHAEGHFMDPYDVVKGLGMPPDDEILWAHRVSSLVTKSGEETTLRKGLHEAMRDDKEMPPDVKGELARRVLVFYRSKKPAKGLGLMAKGFPPPQPGKQGPQPGKRPQPMQQQQAPTGKPKMMDMSQPGKAPPSLADKQPPGGGGIDPMGDNPQIDMAGIDEQPQDPALLQDELRRLQDQLHSLHANIAGSKGHIHMHNAIKALLRNLFENPTPEGVREAKHQVAHFSALVGGAPDQDPNMMDPNNPQGQPGGPQFRAPNEKPSGGGGGGPPGKKAAVTLNKAFGESGAPSTAIARPKSASPAPAAGGAAGHGGEGSRGGHIVGHTAQGDPIYASHNISPAPPQHTAMEDAQQKHMRLKQQMMDAAKALHEHEQAHGLQSSFGGGSGGQQQGQLGGQAPGWTSPTAQTVIRGQQATPGAAKPAITLNAAKPAQPAVGAAPAKPALAAGAATTVSGPPTAVIPPAPQAGTGVVAPQAPAQNTTVGRKNTSPEARGQAKPGAAPQKSISGPAEGNIEDSKKIADAVSKDGYVGKTSTGKEIKIGADTSNMSPQELNEAAQLHRAAQQHLLAAANATGKDEYRQAAKKHLNEEFRLTSEFTSHQGGQAGWLGAPMQKALAWKPLKEWGALPFLRALPRRLDRRPKLKLVKALGEERAGHKYESRTPKAGGGYDYKYAGPVGHNEHERVFDGTHDAIVPHTQIQQDRLSPDDAVERSAKYMEQAQSGEGKKREPLEVWKVNHPDGTHHFALRDGNTTYQMLRKRGWTQFPVKVTKTVDQKDYTPVGAHVSAAEKEQKAQKRKDELAMLKKTVEHFHAMTNPAGVTDEHGQQQGKTALEGGLGHHVKIARDFLDRHRQTLQRDVDAIKAMAPKGAKVKGRVKSLPSTIGKLVRKPKYGDASKLQDGTGMRVVVKSVQDVRSVVAKLKQHYKVVDEDNYIDKSNGQGTSQDYGYRSHHLIIETPDGLQKEIQVRTEGQDKHADWTHDVYKPETEAQEAAMKQHGEHARQYARQAGEWLFKKEGGQNPGPAPQPHPAVEAAFGKLSLDQ